MWAKERMVLNMALDPQSIGKRIKKYRTQKNMSQEELAALIYVTPVHISYVENGSRTPSLDLLVLIANALEVTADDLLAENLTSSSAMVESTLFKELQDCNPDEEKILTSTFTFLKNLLRNCGI